MTLYEKAFCGVIIALNLLVATLVSSGALGALTLALREALGLAPASWASVGYLVVAFALTWLGGRHFRTTWDYLVDISPRLRRSRDAYRAAFDALQTDATPGDPTHSESTCPSTHRKGDTSQ